tara:strand:+ start:25824 stop:26849 length:1026 start_codon:yes stop_codon:yes gene_type:complete
MLKVEFPTSFTLLPYFKHLSLDYKASAVSKTRENIAQFCIDANKQNKPELDRIEREEPGYLKGVIRAFGVMLDEIDAPLSVELLLKYHLLATETVEMQRLSPTDKGVFRKEDVGFWVMDNNASEAGILAVLKKMCAGDNKYLFARDDIAPVDEIELLEYDIINSNTIEYYIRNKIDYFKSRIISQSDSNIRERALRDIAKFIKKYDYRFRSQQFGLYAISDDQESITLTETKIDVATLVAEAIQTYHESITKAESKNEALDCIIDCVQTLEQIHPFKDANCRVLVSIILNKLLLQNGCPPTMINDLNCFDLFDRDALVKEVVQGIPMETQAPNKSPVSIKV